MNVAIYDETTTGGRRRALGLELPEPTITARELIRARIFEEVRAHNANQVEVYAGLVQPQEAEVELNGYRLRRTRPLDWHQQAEAALQAFAGNQLLVLVDGRQIEALEEQIRVRPTTEVTFLKLIPLVGG